MKVYYTCKHCGNEMEVHVTINEEDDLPTNCDYCGQPIPDSAHEKVNEAACEKTQEQPDRD